MMIFIPEVQESLPGLKQWWYLHQKSKRLFVGWNHDDFIPEFQEFLPGLKQWGFYASWFCAQFELVDFIYHRLKALEKSLTTGQYIWFETSGLELNPRHFEKKRNECDFVELKGSKRQMRLKLTLSGKLEVVTRGFGWKIQKAFQYREVLIHC